MHRPLLLALLISVASAAGARAQDDAASSFALDDTSALVTACTVPVGDPLHELAKGFCLGYMTGAMQLYRAAAASPNVENFVCPSGEVSRAEMRDVFLAWAARHPDRMSEPPVDSLLRAAVDRFPCS